MRNRLPDLLPSSIASFPVDVVIEPSLAGAAKELVAHAGLGGHLLVVCDQPTYAALGERLMRELFGLDLKLLMLEGKPHADEETVTKIRAQGCDGLIAVGSGTISDLCKYASYLDKKPYAVFPTAPSMNGYLSANASITIKEIKSTLPAHLPKGVFCDLEVLSRAPKRLIRSGLGDCLCRPTAQADWLLSHLLLDTPYTPVPFELLVPYEKELFANGRRLMAGDMRVMELLIKTLLVSGLGMVIANGSYPASEGEHLIAHTMQMVHGDDLPETYHGEQIGVTTLTMAGIQEKLLSRPLRLRSAGDLQEAITSYFSSVIAPACIEAQSKKYLPSLRGGNADEAIQSGLLRSARNDKEVIEEIEARLAERDTQIRDALRRVMLPEDMLRDVLVDAGAPATVAVLGWNAKDYAAAVSHARFIRDRFTFLDLQ